MDTNEAQAQINVECKCMVDALLAIQGKEPAAGCSTDPTIDVHTGEVIAHAFRHKDVSETLSKFKDIDFRHPEFVRLLSLAGISYPWLINRYFCFAFLEPHRHHSCHFGVLTQFRSDASIKLLKLPLKIYVY